MSARAQSNGIKASAYLVLAEMRGGKDAYTVGPYRAGVKAEADAAKFNSIPGCSASVEPIYSPENFQRILRLP